MTLIQARDKKRGNQAVIKRNKSMMKEIKAQAISE